MNTEQTLNDREPAACSGPLDPLVGHPLIERVVLSTSYLLYIPCLVTTTSVVSANEYLGNGYRLMATNKYRIYHDNGGFCDVLEYDLAKPVFFLWFFAKYVYHMVLKTTRLVCGPSCLSCNQLPA